MKLCAVMLGAVITLALSFSACGAGKVGVSGGEGGTPPPSSANEWAWISGANVANQSGSYGTPGTAASGNAPGAREQAVGWTDAGGNFWLFGGNGFDSAGNDGFLNDLWKYSSGEWTWIGGSNQANQWGTYGTLGTADSGNIPGARNSEVRWIDASGNFWLFGGGGYDSIGNFAPLNDLWKYSSGQWTWMSGSNIAFQPGTYGTEGQAAPGNVPGARFHAVSWIDMAGNLWLFGGNIDRLNTGGEIYLNDLWRYGEGQWAWMGGASASNQPGTYGVEGTTAAGNTPGAREQAVGWTDTAGNFWLFGGNGYDSNGTYGFLNDLWQYNVSSGQWTWMGGSNTINQTGTYGTQGTAAVGNIPGARNSAMSWTDISGNFWLFGGYFHNASTGQIEYYSDLWKYNSGEWMWVSGSSADDQPPTYGTMGTPASDDNPGARHFAFGWSDTTGYLYLFGGNSYNTGDADYRNDLWRYEP